MYTDKRGHNYILLDANLAFQLFFLQFSEDVKNTNPYTHLSN